MKRYTVPALLLFVFVVAIGGWFLSYRRVAAPPIADVARDGLHGPVAQVTVETAPLVDRFGEWVEAASSLESETVYDQQGRVTDLRRYRSDNSLDYRLVSRYEEGNLVEEASFDGFETPLYTWNYSYDEGELAALSGYDEGGRQEFKTVYTYAEDRLATETSYNADESLNYVTDYSYTASGYTRATTYYSRGEPEYHKVEKFAGDNLSEELAYGLEDTLLYRVSYRYNDRGRLLEETAYGADGVLEYRLENDYDSAGNLTETTEFDADNEPFFSYGYSYDERDTIVERSSRSVDGSGSTLRYDYTYDDFGNWTLRRSSRLVTRFGEDVFEPFELTRRTLSYHD